MKSWRVLLLCGAPLAGGLFSLLDARRKRLDGLASLGEIAGGVFVAFLLAAAVVLTVFVVQTRRAPPPPDSARAALATWWPVPAAAMAAAFFMLQVGAVDGKASAVEIMQGMALAAAVCAWGAFEVVRRRRRKAAGEFTIASRDGELPAVEWEERQVGGGVGGLRVWVRRRLAVERDADGSLHFVVTTLTDETYKAAVLAGGLGQDMLRKHGLMQKVSAARRPWAALESFIVTDDVTYYGLKTGGPQPPKPNPVIIANFGMAGGQVVVSDSEERPYEIAHRHSVMTLMFIERRAEHLRRLQGEALQAQKAAGAERPSEI